MRKNILVFIKSFVITAFSVVMAVALFLGIAMADTNIRRTTGSYTDDIVVYNNDTKILSVNMFGQSMSADMGAFSRAVKGAESLSPLIPPEFRLIGRAVGFIADEIQALIYNVHK